MKLIEGALGEYQGDEFALRNADGREVFKRLGEVAALAGGVELQKNRGQV